MFTQKTVRGVFRPCQGGKVVKINNSGARQTRQVPRGKMGRAKGRRVKNKEGNGESEDGKVHSSTT